MHRLFVAIRPPTSIRDQLLDMMEGVNGVRWQDEEQLHLTLLFIGEVEHHQADDLAGALYTVRHPRFELALKGIDSFDRRGKATTLWAGVTPHDELRSLHKKVEQAASQAGIQSDRRAYTPHITLARIARSAGSLANMLAMHGGITSNPFEVADFRLYESQLTPQGAHYTVVERYALD